jgi:hypothetical protein
VEYKKHEITNKKIETCQRLPLAPDRRRSPATSLPTVTHFTSNPFGLSELVCWHRSLVGAWVLQPEVIAGKPGASMKYKASLQIRRKLWCSDAFKVAKPDLWALIVRHVGARNSRWKLLDTVLQFDRLCWLLGAHKFSMVLALVSDAEILLPEFQEKHVHSAASLLQFITHLDDQRGSIGSCGF